MDVSCPCQQLSCYQSRANCNCQDSHSTIAVTTLIPPQMNSSRNSLITINNASTVAAAMKCRAFPARRAFWLNECGRRIAVRRSIATNTSTKMEKNTATLSAYNEANVVNTLVCVFIYKLLSKSR